MTVAEEGHTGRYPDMTVVDGRPAICFFDAGTLQVKYVRSADIDGNTWGLPVTLGSSSGPGGISRLAIVDGRPAVSFTGEEHRQMYIRAADAGGDSWMPALQIGEHGGINLLAVVDNMPLTAALSNYGCMPSQNLHVISAGDSSGQVWGREVHPVTENTDSFYYVNLAEISGMAGLSFFRSDKGLYYAMRP